MRVLVWLGVLGSCALAGIATSPLIGVVMLPLAVITMLRPAKKRQHR